jgi:hypothetical protein
LSNALIWNPGNIFNGSYNGIIGTPPQTGTGNTHTTTTVDTLTFNPQTSGPSGGALPKGSFVSVSSGGHAPDVLASVASATSITLLTATSSTATGATIKVFPYPSFISGEATTTAATNTITSSYWVGVNGTGGVFDRADFSGAYSANLFFYAGGAFGGSLTGSPCLQGWFLRSLDGGASLFETATSNLVMPRAADFTIPLFPAAYSAGNINYATNVQIPSEPFKVLIYNASTQAMPSLWYIGACPIGVQLTT